MLKPAAALYDRFMHGVEEACLSEWRAELLAGLGGSVLEVGAGTGANVALYPAEVTELVLSEPDRHMRRLLEPVAARRRATVVDAPAERLPFEASSFDAVVATLVLCSVRDPDAALSEIHRVLRPGGRLVFMEHVAAVDRPSRLAWQRRIEPGWRLLSGNCHLTRRTEDAIVRTGFTIERIERESMRKAPGIVRPTIRGVGRRPAAT
ncbi:MAG: class I SAM-dependent methyltransferase [Actinomycetota bacterium]|nr:class I SAM-dependent methyltransferase [Actinomycetota bacterium]